MTSHAHDLYTIYILFSLIRAAFLYTIAMNSYNYNIRTQTTFYRRIYVLLDGYKL